MEQTSGQGRDNKTPCGAAFTKREKFDVMKI